MRMKFDPVETWLANVSYSNSRSESTKINYEHNFKEFCEFINLTPQDILTEYERSTDREFKRKYSQLIKHFIAQLHGTGEFTDSTITVYIASVKSFFKYNNLPLGYIPLAKADVTYHNRPITREEIVQITEIAEPRDRAFFSVMAQSGLRPSTICELKIKDVEGLVEDKPTNPNKAYLITIPKEITKGKIKSYFTFVGSETIEHLRTYLKTRKNSKPEDYLFMSKDETKALNRGTVTHNFRDYADQLKETGELEFESRGEKPSELRLYSLRKYFRKMGGHAGGDFCNFWMGHRADYQNPHIPASDKHYFDKEDVEYHREKYEKEALPNLRIGSRTPTEREREIEEYKERIKELEDKFQFLSGLVWDVVSEEQREIIRKKFKDQVAGVSGYGEEEEE